MVKKKIKEDAADTKNEEREVVEVKVVCDEDVEQLLFLKGAKGNFVLRKQ
jgi:hypothetical protein